MELKLQRHDARIVLNHPEIYKTVAEDDGQIVMPEEYWYLCGYVPELMGCFILHKQGKVTVECHVQVLPEFRRDYADEFGHKAIEWVWQNTDALKLVAQIPFLYPNVKDFALKMGFEIEGINEASYMKRGKIHNQWYLGLIKV